MYKKKCYKRKRERDESDDESSSEIKKANLSKDVYRRGNHITFRGDVNRNNIYKLKEEIDALNFDFFNLKKNLEIKNMIPKPIFLHINSYGGELDISFLAIDVIKNSRIPVHTIVEGRCASAATLISVVGQKRYMTEHSRMLIHQLRSGFGGKMADLEFEMEECRDSMNDIVNIYKKHTKMSKKDIRKQLTKEQWFDFSTCKRKGLIDKIWKNNN